MSEDIIKIEDGVSVVLAPTAIESVTRAEFDIAIATAHRFPRSIQRFRERAMSLATLDEEVAASMFYKIPRGGKAIEGPSVRLAEVVASTYGNIKVAARIIEVGEKEIVAQGVAHDLETNFSNSVEVHQRITDRNGKRYNDDMISVACQAACSKARRNAVNATVPFAFIKPIYDAAKKVAVGDARTLSDRRGKTIDAFLKAGITQDRIFATLGVVGMDDINLEHLETLKGLWTAIKDGEQSIDEAFPDPRLAARMQKDSPKTAAKEGATA